MGDLNNINVNPFDGDVIKMLQSIIRTLEAGRVYNPMGIDKINAKIDEIERAIYAIKTTPSALSGNNN